MTRCIGSLVAAPNPLLFTRTDVRPRGKEPGLAVTTASSVSTQRPLTQAARNSGAARQIKEQRRRYANAVLQSLARSQQGRSAAQVQRILRGALKPLGVRLPPGALHELAASISAGQPVELP